MNAIQRNVCLSLVIGLTVCMKVQAYEFVPSATEFATWPVYCQARYVTTDIGHQQSWTATFPQAVVDQQIAEIGWETFERLHHYCAGITWLNRARLEGDPNKKKFDLRNALDEVTFTSSRMDKSHPLATTVQVTLAEVCRASGDYDCALQVLKEAMDRQPTAPAPYAALAIVYRDRKQLDLAREMLERGDKATQGQSAEINYNLGLLLIELHDYDGAVAHAKRAYELGHPLPGLKNKLVRLGKWPATVAITK